MKVLMFGWEFPPHISGGLGTACAGLAQALGNEQVDILFTVPKLHGGEAGTRTTFVNASSVPIPQLRPPALTSTYGFNESKAIIAKRHSVTTGGERTVLEIPSYLSPYSGTIAPSFSLERWNYSFADMEDRTVPANLRRRATAGAGKPTGKEAVVKPYSFSGGYSNLLEEVDRYAHVGEEIARTYAFDVIHAHDWMTYPAAIAAKKISGKPLVVHVHATEMDRSGEHGNPAIMAIERKGMEEADKVVTVSRWTQQIATSHYHIDPGKIEIIHNGISLKPNQESEKRFSPPVDAPIVTFLGRITYQKGPMFFVEAARLVHNQFPDAHFVVAGSGDQLPRMIERIAQEKLSSHFHFTGFLSGGDIDRIWAMSNVYVMPSVSEPFGIATLEAIQAGVPVILSKQAGVAEVMPDAIKVDFWNCEALADAICNVLRYKSLANTMKKNGSERIKNLTWDKAAKKLTRLYHELTTNHHRKKKPDIVFPGTSTTQAAHAPVF
jgi:glycosyltransferase involved in cell wall biosynthesis